MPPLSDVTLQAAQISWAFQRPAGTGIHRQDSPPWIRGDTFDGLKEGPPGAGGPLRRSVLGGLVMAASPRRGVGGDAQAG